VISGAGEQHALDLSSLNVDLVICDSFSSTDEISFFRKLCECCGFFSTLKSDNLDPEVRWGISNFRATSRKYNAGGYSEALSQAQISSLVLKVSTVKRCVGNYSKLISAKHPVVPLDEVFDLCEKQVLGAIVAQQIVPYFQPKICLKTNKTLGVEVLARWEHPDKGLLFPSAFLYLVDEGALHGQLFSSMLHQGLKLQKYLYSISQALVFSYNIETTQLLVEGFAEGLIKQIEKEGVPLSLITLELTEKTKFQLDMAAIENITKLVKSGINLSLDDFGTGYSSVSRLAELPFNQIKLDSEFVAKSLGFKESRIIESIAALAFTLKLEVVAEGVETEKQRVHLEKLGVHSAQGYLFHKPMTSAALVSALLADPPRQRYSLQC
jgi:EAL domain-containing protein (putative c-di-GMP-specific phosphodiesterase class I)